MQRVNVFRSICVIVVLNFDINFYRMQTTCFQLLTILNNHYLRCNPNLTSRSDQLEIKSIVLIDNLVTRLVKIDVIGRFQVSH